MLLKLTTTKEETPGIKSFIWRKPPEFTFYPGQYLEYKLPVTDPRGDSRPFTIAASPTEDFLMLSTKVGLSPFKKALIKLKTGDQIKTSHPAGTFTLDEKSEAVFITGGIGITPFRSMIKWAYDQKLKTPMTLIFLNSDNNFPFKKLLNGWQKSLPNLTIHFINTTTQGRLDKEKLNILYPKPYTLNPIFYLAGPPKMVDSFEEMYLI